MHITYLCHVIFYLHAGTTLSARRPLSAASAESLKVRNAFLSLIKFPYFPRDARPVETHTSRSQIRYVTTIRRVRTTKFNVTSNETFRTDVKASRVTLTSISGASYAREKLNLNTLSDRREDYIKIGNERRTDII
ncbi:hypothetical protein EVAR_18878_1 [Eumeta japonica]|uniref:Uncharacterized protein n=1 Tax=Eumeta variegata TaxID=151549 RepID=A0A4C1V319_EUMVA|nr:hypothetical protein EVAR_18878_1 [Eumeta japonica]